MTSENICGMLRENVARELEARTSDIFGERLVADDRVRASVGGGEARHIQYRYFVGQVAVWRFRLLHLLTGCLLMRG
jgi:hypothetical protein